MSFRTMFELTLLGLELSFGLHFGSIDGGYIPLSLAITGHLEQ